MLTFWPQILVRHHRLVHMWTKMAHPSFHIFNKQSWHISALKLHQWKTALLLTLSYITALWRHVLAYVSDFLCFPKCHWTTLREQPQRSPPNMFEDKTPMCVWCGFCTKKVKWLCENFKSLTTAHKICFLPQYPSFHPDLAQLLTRFPDNWQKKMQMNVFPSTTVMWILGIDSTS